MKNSEKFIEGFLRKIITKSKQIIVFKNNFTLCNKIGLSRILAITVKWLILKQ
jgi:hypothetical protein